jgi:prolyl-tRNA synthetase
VVEASHDEGGIIWPKSLAPFQVHIISLREDDTAERIAFDLEQDGYDVLVDERDESPGKKFADSDLLGIPLRVVVSKRTLERECVELRYRADGKTVEVPIHELPHCVWDHYTDKS